MVHINAPSVIQAIVYICFVSCIFIFALLQILSESPTHSRFLHRVLHRGNCLTAFSIMLWNIFRLTLDLSLIQNRLFLDLSFEMMSLVGINVAFIVVWITIESAHKLVSPNHVNKVTIRTMCIILTSVASVGVTLSAIMRCIFNRRHWWILSLATYMICIAMILSLLLYYTYKIMKTVDQQTQALQTGMAQQQRRETDDQEDFERQSGSESQYLPVSLRARLKPFLQFVKIITFCFTGMLCYQCVAIYRLIRNWDMVYGREGDTHLLINPLPSLTMILMIVSSVFAAIPVDWEMIQRRIFGICWCCSRQLQFSSLMRAQNQVSNDSFHTLNASQDQNQQSSSKQSRFGDSLQQSSQVNSFKPQILLNDTEIRLLKSDSFHVSRTQCNQVQQQLPRLINNPPELTVLPGSCTPSPTINERVSPNHSHNDELIRLTSEEPFDRAATEYDD